MRRPNSGNTHLPCNSVRLAVAVAAAVVCFALLTLAPHTWATPGLQPDNQTVPTRTPERHKSDSDDTQGLTPTSTPWPVPLYDALSVRERFGVGVPLPPMDPSHAQRLGIGWYHAWQVLEDPPSLEGVDPWQVVRVTAEGLGTDVGTITRTVQAHPGSVWLIGNEPDVIWQDSVPPERYARAYHDVYHLLKQADPGCQVAVGGIAQPTPLRLEYLDSVLQVYQDTYDEPLPCDMWHVHNFILREERGSWGVGVPPGIAADTGMLYEIEDDDNMEIFEQQIVAFRQWMADRGQRNKPLIVSEYGIPMPEDYGFGFERVRGFMSATFDLFLSATDEELGYPSDGNRLVQRWAWFSMSSTAYPTGNLTDPDTRQLTRLGEAFGDYVAGH